MFTGFDVSLSPQEVVSGEQVFVTTDKTAIDNFIQKIESEQNTKQAFGIGIFVDFKDSNGVIIPQDTSFLKIPLTQTYTASLVSDSGQILDYAVFQFDVVGVLANDDKLQVTADYEILSNDSVFLTGTVFGVGETNDKTLNLKFEQGSKTGEALELSFAKNEIPFIQDSRNTLEFRITSVEAIIGSGFETDKHDWSGSFPILTVKFDADSKTRTVRDYTGLAIQTLPNDVGIQSCGYDNGRLSNGESFGRYAPIITVKTLDGKTVLVSDAPNWGFKDSDFNSLKCGNIITGLERNFDYEFHIAGDVISVTTPSEPFLYKAECTYYGAESTGVFPCKSNFGWSR